MKMMQNDNRTAITYYRYSSHRQGEQSIEGQRAEAERWAKANGYTIVKEYADRAMTGTNDDREQFQLMLRELERLRPAVLILWKVDRMGRNKEEIAFNKYRCKKNGVKVVYTAESIPDTPEGVSITPSSSPRTSAGACGSVPRSARVPGATGHSVIVPDRTRSSRSTQRVPPSSGRCLSGTFAERLRPRSSMP